MAFVGGGDGGRDFSRGGDEGSVVDGMSSS